MSSSLQADKKDFLINHFGGLISDDLDFSHVAKYFQNQLSIDFDSLTFDSHAEVEAFRNKMYQVVHSTDFSSIYFRLVKLVSDFLPFDVLCQKRPTVRIQPPGDNSIIFHIDEWAGHDLDSLNVWFPLVDIHESASLGVVNPSVTNSLLSSFYAGDIG